MPIYHGAASMAKDGFAAYCDFWFPYPPLSLPLIYFPARFFTDFDRYRLVFRLEMMAFDAATALLLLLFLRNRMKVSRWTASIAVSFYCLLGFSGAHLIYDRLDIAMSMLMLATVYFYTGDGWKRWGSYVSIVAGALVKILPFFFIPLFCVLEWFRGDGDRWPDRRRAWTPLIWGALPFLAGLVAYNVFVCNQLFSQLSQHTVRGIQIESNWAVPLIIERVVNGSMIQADYTFGAFHILDSCVPPWYLWLAKNLGVILLLGYFALLWRWFRRNLVQSEKLPPYTIAVLLYGIVLFIIATQRVLSPQYFIWMWPFAAIEFAVLKDRRAVVVGAALVFGMTYVVFDIGFFDLLQFDPMISTALIIRNGAATLWALDTIRRSARALRESRRPALNAVLS